MIVCCFVVVFVFDDGVDVYVSFAYISYAYISSAYAQDSLYMNLIED
jgi:hypothetical protein